MLGDNKETKTVLIYKDRKYSGSGLAHQASLFGLANIVLATEKQELGLTWTQARQIDSTETQKQKPRCLIQNQNQAKPRLRTGPGQAQDRPRPKPLA